MSDPAADPAAAFTAATLKPRHALAKMGIRLPVLRVCKEILSLEIFASGVGRSNPDRPRACRAEQHISVPGRDARSRFLAVPVARPAAQCPCRPVRMAQRRVEPLRLDYRREPALPDAMGIEQSASAPEWVASAKALLQVRNTLAMHAGLVPWPTLMTVSRGGQSRDRGFHPRGRSSLGPHPRHAAPHPLDRLVRDQCTEDERTEALALLQRDYDDGRWPRAVADLNDLRPPEPALLLDAILRSLPRPP